MPPVHASPVVRVQFHLRMVIAPPGVCIIPHCGWCVVYWCGVASFDVGAVSGGGVGAGGTCDGEGEHKVFHK